MNRPTGAASLLTLLLALLFPTPAERSPGEAAELTKQDKSIDTLIGDRAHAPKNNRPGQRSARPAQRNCLRGAQLVKIEQKKQARQVDLIGLRNLAASQFV
jgi:hypothetical protein